MRKIFAILFAVVLVLSFSVPALADEIDTSVTVSSGSDPANAPIVKAKWETPDDDPATPGIQVLPPLNAVPGTKQITICAVVTDPQGINTIADVYADIYHPLGFPEEGSFKDQIQLLPYLNATLVDYLSPAEIAAGKALVNAADAAGLITYAGTYNLADLIEEIEQARAWIWCATYDMIYHQPAGDYEVEAYAFDQVTHNSSATLSNTFTYVAMHACEFDFTAVNYGNAIVSNPQPVDGDNIFLLGDGKPTVRNIGNTWITLEIMQDDMGFGKSKRDGVDKWDVQYDARLGSVVENAGILFDPAYYKGDPAPNAFTPLPGIIHLCNSWKIDFSIHVIKALNTDPGYPNYTGTMWLQCQPTAFTGPNVPHP